MHISVVLFDSFETLDVFGPVEVFGKLPTIFDIKFYSLAGGFVRNGDGVSIETRKIADAHGETDILFVPAGMGAREEVRNSDLLDHLRILSQEARYVLSVCTGSALLARAGILSGRKATSNKRAFAWVTEQGPDVLWVPKARWVRDGALYTSSGVSAGIDMALGFVADVVDPETALAISRRIEYRWDMDCDHDEFARGSQVDPCN